MEFGFVEKVKEGTAELLSDTVESIVTAKDTVSDIAKKAIENPVDTLNTIALPQVAIIDAVTGAHMLDVLEQVERGAVNEAIHNPKEVLKTAAIGAGIGALTALTGGGALAAIAIGATYFAADELIKNKGDINGVVNDVKTMGETFKNWGEDIATVAGTGPHSAEEIAEANQGLQQLGAFATHTVAGIAGSIAGEAAVTAAGLNRAIPAASSAVPDDAKLAADAPATNRNSLNKLLTNGTADTSLAEDAAILRTRGPADQHYLVLPKDPVTGIEDPLLLRPDAPNYFDEALNPRFIEKAKALDVQQSAKIFLDHGMAPDKATDFAQWVVDTYRQKPAVTLNSPYSRSQDLLHLHMDHVDPQIHLKLAEIAEQNGFSTKTFEPIGDLIPKEAENLQAMWIPADSGGGLGNANPIKMVQKSLPSELKGRIDEHSIALVPLEYQGKDGFVIIDGQASTNGAALEWLQHLTPWTKAGAPNI